MGIVKYPTSIDNIGKEHWRVCVEDGGTRKDRVLGCGGDPLGPQEGTFE